MTKHQRVRYILSYFLDSELPTATELRYASDFQLLVAVVLSAQCTDTRVNEVTPALFAAYSTAERMARADFATLFPYIRSISYPNSKTKYLLATSRMLTELHHGRVPNDMEELCALPGVGRKTANVIAAELYGASVMAVDTHVFRVSRRLQLVPQKARTPLTVEQALMRVLPEEYIRKAHHWLLLHGRYTCKARKPLCSTCGLSSVCPSALPS